MPGALRSLGSAAGHTVVLGLVRELAGGDPACPNELRSSHATEPISFNLENLFATHEMASAVPARLAPG